MRVLLGQRYCVSEVMLEVVRYLLFRAMFDILSCLLLNLTPWKKRKPFSYWGSAAALKSHCLALFRDIRRWQRGSFWVCAVMVTWLHVSIWDSVCVCVHTCMCISDSRTKRPGSSVALRAFSVVSCQKLVRSLYSFFFPRTRRIEQTRTVRWEKWRFLLELCNHCGLAIMEKISEWDSDLTWKDSTGGQLLKLLFLFFFPNVTLASLFFFVRWPVSCQRPNSLWSHQKPWTHFSSSMKPLLR